jgi:hypothetical protein
VPSGTSVVTGPRRAARVPDRDLVEPQVRGAAAGRRSTDGATGVSLWSEASGSSRIPVGHRDALGAVVEGRAIARGGRCASGG